MTIQDSPPGIRPVDFFGSARAVRSNTVNNGGPDPIQGHDVGVFVHDPGRTKNKRILLGQFTGISIDVNWTALPYVAVGSRGATFFDEEILTSAELVKGMLSPHVFRDTFGFKKLAEVNRYLRSARLDLEFVMDPVDWTALDESSRVFGSAPIDRTPSGKIRLENCKVLMLQIVSQAGKGIVANRWKVVSEAVEATGAGYANLPRDIQRLYKPDGDPVSDMSTKTFFFEGYADLAVTRADLVSPAAQFDSPQLPREGDLLGTAVAVVDTALRIRDVLTGLPPANDLTLGSMTQAVNRQFPGLIPPFLGAGQS